MMMEHGEESRDSGGFGRGISFLATVWANLQCPLSKKRGNMCGRTTVAAISVAIGLTIELQGCRFGIQPSMPDIGATTIANTAEIQAGDQTIQDIMSTFKRADEALRRMDLNALMDLYSEDYTHNGYTKELIRRKWELLFQSYDDFSSTHVFSKIKVEVGKFSKAEITCTGSLWATSTRTGERVNIDSWFGAVHLLAYQDGVWRIRGHAGEIPRMDTRRYAPPPRPLF
jgi:ketosteroid isomerase-like protein